jgi:hypothetical protein
VRAAENALRESRRLAEERREKCAPFNRITSAVIRAARECKKRIVPFIQGEDVERREASIFAEFLFFFVHITDRIAFSNLGAESARKLQEIVLPEVFGITVDSHFLGTPSDLKKELRSALYKSAQEASVDYFSSAEWLSKEEPYAGAALLKHPCYSVCFLVSSKIIVISLLGLIGLARCAWKPAFRVRA